jgi:hypothetical protein
MAKKVRAQMLAEQEEQRQHKPIEPHGLRLAWVAPRDIVLASDPSKSERRDV